MKRFDRMNIFLIVFAVMAIVCRAENAFALAATGEKGEYAVGEPGTGSPGGPPGVEVRTQRSIQADTKKAASNTGKTNDSINRAMDEQTALSIRKEQEMATDRLKNHIRDSTKTGALEGQRIEERIQGPRKGDNEVQYNLSILRGNYGATGSLQRSARSAFEKTNVGDIIKGHNGSTSEIAFKTISTIFQSGSLNEQTCQHNQNTKYGACKTGQVAGAFENSEVLMNKADGIQVEQGNDDTKAIAAKMAAQFVGRYAEAKVAALGFKNIRELLVAENKAFENNKKQFAKYNQGEESWEDLVIKASTESYAENAITTMKDLGAMMVATEGAGAMSRAYQSNYTTPNRSGKNPDKEVCEMSQKNSGEKCPMKEGYYASEKGANNMELNAVQYASMNSAGAEQSAVQRRESVQTAVTNATLKSIDQSMGESGSNFDATSIQSAMMELATIIMSPEYQQFYASLDDKKANELVAEASQWLDGFEYQVALNLRKSRFDIEGVTFIAETEETIRKHTTLASVMKDSGVDVASLTPIVGGNKYAALIPNMKDDALRTTPLIMQADMYKDTQGLLKMVSTASIAVALPQQQPVR